MIHGKQKVFDLLKTMEGRSDITYEEIARRFQLRGQQTIQSVRLDNYFEMVLLDGASTNPKYKLCGHWEWHWRNNYAES